MKTIYRMEEVVEQLVHFLLMVAMPHYEIVVVSSAL
jgi:hypothetical protein